MIRALTLLCLLLLPAAAFGRTQVEIKADADRVAAELQQAGSRAKQLNGDTGKEIRKAFADATALVQEIARADMPEKAKGELIIEVAAEAGQAFDTLTEPYDNPVQVQKSRSGFRNVWDAIGARIVAVFGSFARDVKTFPKILPFIGTDARRSHLLNRIAGDMNRAFKEELKTAQTSGANRMGLAGIGMIVEKTAASEPMRYGLHNRLVNLVYKGLAVLTFFVPPVEFAITRTTFSPLVSGTIWMGSFLYLAKARTENSGLGFFRAMNKLRKSTAKALGGMTCEAVLKGE
jgi:hypothetical protein